MNHKKINKIIALFLLELIIILPVYSAALTISNIKVDATDKSAVVTWLTDEDSSTQINYGKDAADLDVSVSSVNLVKNHSVILRNLDKSTAYFFELIAQTPTETLVDDKSGEYYKFVTLAEDTVPPFINIMIPESVDSNELDIIGQTEINTKVELFVNGQARSIVDFADGEITFYGVDLMPNQQNSIFIQATDAAGNTAQKQFTVFSDLIAPSITLVPELPGVIDARTINIAGTISETAFLNITLNNQSVYSAETETFAYSAQLNEGNNYLIIIASDKAGHVTRIEKTIIADTLPPTITGITPVAGSFYYEGRAIIDLQLTTEPGAEVRVYRDSQGVLAKYDETKISGADGKARFDDVELEGPHFGPFSLSAEWPSLREVSSTTGTASLAYQAQQQTQTSERTVRMIIAVRDIAGHVTTQEVRYTIGTCWSGELDFTVLPLLEYQTPTLLSPERLEEGSELISFVLSINYSGQSAPGEWQITDLRVDKACRGGRLGEPEFFLEDDIRYDVSCSILPNAPATKDRNSAGTLWYIRYDLASTAGLTDFTEPDWNIGSRELVFPLKLTIRYKEMEIDPVTGQKKMSAVKTQTKCMSVAYFVDIPIDPRDVLPDFMLEDLPDAMNDTITTLDDLINHTETLTRYVAMGCLGSLIAKFVAKVSRKISCRLQTRTAAIWDKLPAAQQTGTAPTCPITDEKRMSLPLNKDTGRGGEELIGVRPVSILDVFTKKQTETFAQQGRLANAYYLESACPSCARAWKTEAALYKAERWLCDRVFCHKAPAEWTSYENQVKEEDIKKSEKESKSCGTEQKAGVKPLRRIENCNREYGDKLDAPFRNKNICYVVQDDPSITALYVEPTDLGTGPVFTLVKASSGSGPAQLKVIKEGSNYATARSETCKAVCEAKGLTVSGTGCEEEKKCTESIMPQSATKELSEGTTEGYTSDCWVGPENALGDPKKQCCCRKSEDKKEVTAQPTDPFCPGNQPSDKCQGWEYREQQLYKEDKSKKYGTKFPENRYFEGRDTSACFGQNYLFDSPAEGTAGKQPMLDPFRQTTATFQCVCLTGIRQRMMMLRAILTGMMNCLIQIRTTGEADAGVCKEMFTQYICDIIYQIYVWFREGCSPFSSGSDRGQDAKNNADEGNPLAIGFGEFFTTLSNIGSDVSSEYGSTQFANYLGGGEKQVARKICLAAFGFDVGLDFDTFMDMTYTTQFSSLVTGLGLRRDFLTYNPDNNLATYSYRGAWTIYPGCDITSYKIDLTCVTQEERSKYSGVDCTLSSDEENPIGCDCLTSNAPYSARSRTFYTGGPLAASVLEDKDHHMNVEAQYRFDHIRVQLFLNPQANPQQCLPEGHEDGIFYFPVDDRTARDLLDCTVDGTGLFKCTRGLEWEQKGEAYFDYFTSAECGYDTSCSLLCIDPADGKYKDCDNVIFTKGKKISIKSDIKTKGKQCLKITLKSEGGELINEVRDIGQGTFETALGYDTIPFEKTLITVSDEHFEGTGVTISTKGVNCTLQYPIPPPLPQGVQETTKTTGKITVEFERSENPQGTINYKIKDEKDLIIYNKDGIPAHLTDPTSALDIPNYYFKFSGFVFRLVPIKQGNCTIETKRGTGAAEQNWSLNLELLHPDNQRSCATTNERISVVAEETAISKLLDVKKDYSYTAPSAAAAPAASGNIMFKITRVGQTPRSTSYKFYKYDDNMWLTAYYFPPPMGTGLDSFTEETVYNLKNEDFQNGLLKLIKTPFKSNCIPDYSFASLDVVPSNDISTNLISFDCNSDKTDQKIYDEIIAKITATS